jgi:hypothetical protein
MQKEVLLEIEELRQKQKEYRDLYETITSGKAELSTNHEEYSKALKEVLAVFDDEEAKALLAEQGVDGVQSLLREHADTDEAKNLAASDALVKENLAKLKTLKAEVIEKFDIKSPNYQTLDGVASYIQQSADAIDREVFQKSVDTVEGREAWPIAYPSGIYHEQNQFEKSIKEGKEPKLREIYHELGDNIDKAFLEAIKEYKPADERDRLRMKDSYKEGRHLFDRGTISIENNTIIFHYGAGFGSIEYKIKQGDSGSLYFSRTKEYEALLPDDFLKLFNSKLRQIDDSFRSTAESL